MGETKRERVYRMGRFCVSIEIHDNLTQTDIISEGFNCNALGSVEHACDRAIAAVRAAEAQGDT
jgi:hypothetical protein